MVSDNCCVLIVDDDPAIREMLRDYLESNQYQVYEADSGAGMREQLSTALPHVVLLDVGLPGEDGLSLARYVREHYDIGIIMVSGAGETIDRIVGLEVGADDYLAKPFDPRELRARLKSVVRRYQRAQPSMPQSMQQDVASDSASRVRFGLCTLDLNSYQLFSAADEEIPMTTMEFELLKIFAERPNRPLTRDQILSLTQNRDWDPYDRSIDIRIARLRRKIEIDANKPQVIKTVRGVGYMFVPQAKPV
ncbi:MAG: response regulator [Gammaproteobacteria bacterium]|jgi:two-component system phosphate regulon response regulator OmpR|nr:response regulator [Gammaproteobacteria bacterium]